MNSRTIARWRILACRLLGAVALAAGLAGCAADARPKPPTVDELIAMLQRNDEKAQLEATGWVRELGPKAAAASTALIGVLNSPSVTVRLHAAGALGHLGADKAGEVVPALARTLRDPEYSVRRAAADALGELGPAAAVAIPALEEFKSGGDPCSSADSALSRIRK